MAEETSTKQRIERAALRLFVAQGIASATTREIATLRALGFGARGQVLHVERVAHCGQADPRTLQVPPAIFVEMIFTTRLRKRCTGPRNLQTISPPDVRAFMKWLRQDARTCSRKAAPTGAWAANTTNTRAP